MNKASGGNVQAPVPMYLFATWDIDRSASHCIPRICNMTVCKLIVLKELDKDVQSIFIAVKMQGSKRVFRSNEILMSSNGLVDTRLELTFSLQYPHFVKRDQNRLQIMLQRKKRYKNRAMLGYKTLAVGRVDMAQLIQCPIPDESVLDLLAVRKDQDGGLSVAAQIVVSSMSSLPIDADAESERVGKHTGTERSPEVDNYSEEDEETYSSDQDIASDNPQEYVDDEARGRKMKNRRKVRMSSASRQQNFIKTKVAALLRKFKQVSDEELDPTLEQDPEGNPSDPVDYGFLYDELEDFNLSDSCPEVEDNISIVSTPKPKLRPFFDRISHSSSQTEISSLREQSSLERHEHHASQIKLQTSLQACDDDKDTSDGSYPVFDRRESTKGNTQSSISQPNLDDKPTMQFHPISEQNIPLSAPSSPESRPAHDTKARSASLRNTPALDQTKDSMSTSNGHTDSVSEYLTTLENEEGLPESMFLIDGKDKYGCCIADALSLPSVGLTKPIVTHSHHDIQNIFSGFLTRLQKYLNRNSTPPTAVKTAVVGSDIYLNSVLRQFVESLSSRPSEWQSFFVFHAIPIGSTRLCRYLSSIDPRYGSLFGEASWKESIDKLPDGPSPHVSFEQNKEYLTLASKFREYLSEASGVVSLVIAEAMLTFRQTSGDEDCSHKFLPFIAEVKVGENDLLNIIDSDKEELTASVIGSANAPVATSASSFVTPPSSPCVPATTSTQNSTSNVTAQPSEVKLGLQVDYWKERDASKYTLKTNFKSFHVSRLPPTGERQSLPGLALDIVTKGKKNLMRLPGKKGKEKEAESKSQAVGNINRLICASKHQHSLLQVKVDGVEWKDVKFFQLSSHWSSHIKAFPVAVFLNV